MRVRGKVFLALILIVVAVVLIALFAHRYMFSSFLGDGFFVRQVPFTGVYNIDRYSAVVVKEIWGWIMDEQALYGSFRNGYFYIDKAGFLVETFDDLSSFNLVLLKKGKKKYMMSDEITVGHLW